MSNRKFSLGLDYGTNSVRALIVDIATGEEVGTGVYDYPSGEQGIIVDPKDPNLAHQHPGDYISGIYGSIEVALKDAQKSSDFSPDRIVGIGVDTTGSTPMPVDKHCVPLGTKLEFKDNPHAQAWLWKDHTSIAEAQEITQKAADQPYLAKCGGAYSSEWFWAKMLKFSRVAPDVAEQTHSWVEQCDFVTAYLTGQSDPTEIRRSACAAGHKALWNSQWGGLPSKEFLSTLSPYLAEMHTRLYTQVFASDKLAGHLDPGIAQKTGLPARIGVAVGAIDAHLGAVGSGIRPGILVKILGTSTCDIMAAPNDGSIPDIPGLCGIAEESVLPGMLGLEAGQAAVGDLFNWGASKLADGDHDRLQREAEALNPGATGLLALDWNNGNRNTLADQELTGLLIGQTLHTTAAEIYRALIEATAFGALRIIQRIEEYGVAVDQVVCCGGIAEKSSFVMQIYADILNRPISITRSSQACALGAAICGAVATGAHPNMETAQKAMCGFKDRVYKPNPDAHRIYAKLDALYLQLHNAFGIRETRTDMSGVMKQLIAIRQDTRN
ncbi:MAG: ribulokinase [Fimbriimonadaceae bacterium]|nr:ribulokinase [Fimbriimonadaceae bacterium]